VWAAQTLHTNLEISQLQRTEQVTKKLSFINKGSEIFKTVLNALHTVLWQTVPQPSNPRTERLAVVVILKSCEISSRKSTTHH